jgi:hypothetical protein
MAFLLLRMAWHANQPVHLSLDIVKNCNAKTYIACRIAVAISHPDQWSIWRWLGQTRGVVILPSVLLLMHHHHHQKNAPKTTLNLPFPHTKQWRFSEWLGRTSGWCRPRNTALFLAARRIAQEDWSGRKKGKLFAPQAIKANSPPTTTSTPSATTTTTLTT